MIKFQHIALFAGSLLLSMPLIAEDKPADAEQAETEIDEGLKKFGYLTGLALGCVADNQKSQLEREAMDVSSEITRMFGTDRAFLFTASFGYGTNIELKTEECKAVLERYDERIASFRKGKGAKQ